MGSYTSRPYHGSGRAMGSADAGGAVEWTGSRNNAALRRDRS
jgi:hypothetical protein